MVVLEFSRPMQQLESSDWLSLASLQPPAEQHTCSQSSMSCWMGPYALLQEMEGGQSAFHVGDVKYHQGQSASIQVPPPPLSSCLVPLSELLSGVQVWLST